MAFFSRFRGGKIPDDQPPALPQFDYELTYVRGNEAVQQALELRNDELLAFTPIIIGTEGNFRHLTDIWDEDSPSPQEYLVTAGQLDLEKWLGDRRRENEDCEDPEFLESITKPSDWNTESGTGEDFSVVREVLSRKVYPWVLLGNIPTPHPYEVPAYLKLGGWNECPDASLHVAIWKRWQDKYGAKILCVSGDVIEATVARPPREKEECYELANEQFLYCSDIVTQGVGSIDALASVLCSGKSWYFWWD